MSTRKTNTTTASVASEVLRFLKANWAAILALCVAAFCLFLTLKYANQPLMDMHSFRQTQTALTSYWMLAEGVKLDYPTPVAGYPWSIPFEFPIYQALAAGISSLFKIPLDASGRILSMAFLLGLAWPAFRLAKRFGVNKEVSWIFCALLWSAPLYLYWGRSFMIETATLFFTFVAGTYLLALNASKPRLSDALLASLFASLAVLQKVTTALPVMAIIGVWTFWSYLKQDTLLRIPKQKWACLLIAYAVPLVIMQLWTSHTDAVKMQNDFGKTLTSGSLMAWNFGTLKQRLTPSVYYDIFFRRIINHNIASVFGLLLILAALIRGDKRVRQAILFSLVLFAFPILLFFNLHRNHNYYQTSCAVFLIAALAISVGLWMPQAVKAKAFVALIAVILVGSNLYIFSTRSYGYFVRKVYSPASDTILAVSQIVRQATPPESALIIFGNDWSSTIAYYAGRKSFTVPDWWCAENHYWPNASFLMGDRRVAGVVCLPNTCVGIAQLLQKPEVKAKPVIFSLLGTYLWLPEAREVHDPISNREFYPLPLDSLNRMALDTVPFSGNKDISNIHR